MIGGTFLKVRASLLGCYELNIEPPHVGCYGLAMIEPGTGIRRILGLQAEKVLDGAFQPDRRGMALSDGWEMAVRTK